jgi:hypothetical protein
VDEVYFDTETQCVRLEPAMADPHELALYNKIAHKRVVASDNLVYVVSEYDPRRGYLIRKLDGSTERWISPRAIVNKTVRVLPTDQQQ